MDTYVIPNEERDRLNILKYISIIFVVYIHSYAVDVNFSDGTTTFYLPQWLYTLEYLISKIIAGCGVPLFFVISSILLFRHRREYNATIKSKIKTLLLPYFIWNSFWIAVFIVLQNLSFTAPYFSGNRTPILQCTFGEWLRLYGIGWDLPYPQDYPLWFMRDLMLINLFYPIIGYIADKFPKQLLIGTIILMFVPVNFPLKEAIKWFCVGACIVKLQIHTIQIDEIPFWKIILIYIVSVLIILVTGNTLIGALFILISMLFWIRVTKEIYDRPKMRNVFLWLSKWTFIIYVAHEMTLSSLQKICFRLLPTSSIMLLLEYICLPVFVIAGCSLAGMLLKRMSPRVYSIVTGTR